MQIVTKLVLDPVVESEEISKYKNDPEWIEVTDSPRSVAFEKRSPMYSVDIATIQKG